VLNEGGFQCPQVYLDRRIYCGQPGSPEYAAYLDDQANYVVRYYVRGLANRLGGVAYYTLNGPNFREGGLSTGMDLRPGYTALQFLAGKLSMALPSTACASQPSQGWLEGYRFTDGAKEYRVYWTNDNQRRAEVRRPTGSIAVYDKLGRTLDMPAASDSIGVGFDPIIVESVPQSAWRCDH
jgi:hypothetical protein